MNGDHHDDGSQEDIIVNLHNKQFIAFQSAATEILYGGAAGGGKSHLMRVCAVAWCLEIPNLQVYIFRRLRDDLIKPYMEGPTGFYAMLAPWIGTYVEIIEDEIRFNNGSRVYLCHCKDEKDVNKYLTADIHVLLIDELTQFTEAMYRFLRGRVRMPEQMRLSLPSKYQEAFPRIMCASNPGGLGHLFVKSTFVDGGDGMVIREMPENEGGLKRQFIPSKLADNPSLNYEKYRAALSGLGDEVLVKAMLNGDWDIVAGAAFKISRQTHMVRPFTPPAHWTRFSSLDWGYVKPYANIWFCVVEGVTKLEAKDEWPEMWLPHGAIVLYRELYGWNGKPDEGSRTESHIVARNILKIERDANERMDYRIADTQIWSKTDGSSIQERMFNATKDKIDCPNGPFNPRQSKKDRQLNYNEVCARLRGEEIEPGRFVPMFYATANCTQFWRTVPTLALDELHPEKGPDEAQEDHIYDALSYALISRPFVRTKQQRDTVLLERARKQAKIEKVDPYRIKKGAGR